MYFHSRHQAGRMLASRLLEKYRGKSCVVVALDDGGAVIGSEIAKQFGVALNIMVSEAINLPMEPITVGGMAPDGQFVYNSAYSKADIEDMASENRGFLEEQKMNKFHDLNTLIGSHGVIDRKSLNGQNVILVSDGLQNTFKLDVAHAFLKVVKYEALVVATPLAAVNVVDWMHVHADGIYCLSVVEEYSDTNHYYDVQDVPEHDDIMKIFDSKHLGSSV